MFKKIISYLIVFSIFYSDIAYCGNVTYGMFSEEGKRSHTTIQAESYPPSTDAESLASRTPSLLSLDEDSFVHVPGGFNFDAANDGSDKKRLSKWSRVEKTESKTQSTTSAVQDVNGLEEYHEDMEDALPEEDADQKLDKKSNLFKASEDADNASSPQWIQVENSVKKRRSLTAETPSINFDKEEMGDFVVVNLSKSLHLTPELEAFLKHLKIRIVDGTPNWKQVFGALGGVGIGAGVAYPLGVIYFIDLIQNNLSAKISWIEIVLVAVTMGTLTLDAFSRSTSLLVELGTDNLSSFSTQKSVKYRSFLYLSGAFLYVSSFTAGLLPVYYLYKVECYDPKNDQKINNKVSSGCPEPDLLMWFSLPLGIPSLILDTTLHYGHQLFHHAKRWIDHYFFHQLKENALFSSAEITRQLYLKQFKEIQELIDRSTPAKHTDLYKEIVRNKATQATDPTVKEALHVLQKLQQFHTQNKHHLQPEEPNSWRKTVSTWIGRGGAFVASLGRHLAFWKAVDEVLEGVALILKNNWDMDFPESAQLALSIIFGGIIAGLVQGFIEKDAIQQTVYDMLGGRKITKATSHAFLRRGIMIYNSFVGACATIPYMWVGFKLIEGCHPESTHPIGKHCGWDWSLPALYLTLTSFGWANALNEGQAFNNSILNIVSGFDSLMSYCYPFEGYKRDKAMDIVVKLRARFKEMRPEVLMELDKVLKEQQASEQQKSTDRTPLLVKEHIL